MNTRSHVWALALLGAVAAMAPACDGDDDGSNDGDAGAGGQAGHSTAGSTSTAGHAGTGGNINVSGTGFGGDGAGAGGLGGAGGGTDCGTVDAASGVVICGEIKYRARTGSGCFYSPGGQEPIGGGGGAASGGEGGVGSGCDPDKCTEKPRGYCDAEAPGASGAGPVTCHYGCLTDEDCVTDEICVCADPSYGGRCVHAFCKTDADCANGNRCGSHTDCDQFSCNEDPQCAVY